MNTKLAKFNFKFSDIRLSNAGGRRGPTLALVIISTQRDSGKKNNSILRFSLSDRLLSMTGWRAGDLLDFEVKDGMAHLFRSDKGVTLSKQVASAKRLHVRFRMPSEYLDGFPNGIGQEVEATPGRVAFLLPDYDGSTSDNVT